VDDGVFMVDAINSLGIGGATAPGEIGAGTSAASPAATGKTASSSFSEFLQKSIDDVSKLQQDASQAVQDLATGKTDDVTGVMTAVEKSDVAFKTLLAIRGKLMDAFQYIKSMQM
jgi:flagellar hook-basal body complex protein FliE